MSRLVLADFKNRSRDRNEKLRHSVTGEAALIGMAVFLILIACFGRKTIQASNPVTLPLTLTGEYSYDGISFMPMDEAGDIPVKKGTLYLKGRFTEDIPVGCPVWVYLNHLGFKVYHRDNLIGVMDPVDNNDAIEVMCGEKWSCFLMPELAEGEELLIELYNPHSFGNGNAYQEFLDSLRAGSSQADFARAWTQTYISHRILGIMILATAFVIIGAAITFRAMRMDSNKVLWSLGLMSFFGGVYIIMDAPDVCFFSETIVFNTYVRQLSLMLFVLEMGNSLWMLLQARGKKFTEVTVMTGKILAAGLMLVALSGQIVLFDMAGIWYGFMGCASVVFLIALYLEWKEKNDFDKCFLISYAVLNVGIIMDVLVEMIGKSADGMWTKSLFIILFVFHIVRTIRRVSVQYTVAIKAGELEKELQNNRIVMATSQIRTHFVFNVLNAISGMCKYNPEKADDTIIRFARYLRGNIDIMQKDEMISFDRERSHLEDYMELEKIRFGEKLQFVVDAKVTDFYLPALILQPVIENAIYHGIREKVGGGTIWLKTRRESGNVIIQVEDDGVGFVISQEYKEGSVGLKNVCFRLEHLVQGTLQIASSPGVGTKVEITIPYKEC